MIKLQKSEKKIIQRYTDCIYVDKNEHVLITQSTNQLQNDKFVPVKGSKNSRKGQMTVTDEYICLTRNNHLVMCYCNGFPIECWCTIMSYMELLLILRFLSVEAFHSVSVLWENRCDISSRMLLQFGIPKAPQTLFTTNFDKTVVFIFPVSSTNPRLRLKLLTGLKTLFMNLPLSLTLWKKCCWTNYKI